MRIHLPPYPELIPWILCQQAQNEFSSNKSYPFIHSSAGLKARINYIEYFCDACDRDYNLHVLDGIFRSTWVPTPMKLVHTMLKMAVVGPGDTVYDLGCGDGRLVITAAKHYGARAE